MILLRLVLLCFCSILLIEPLYANVNNVEAKYPIKKLTRKKKGRVYDEMWGEYVETTYTISVDYPIMGNTLAENKIRNTIGKWLGYESYQMHDYDTTTLLNKLVQGGDCSVYCLAINVIANENDYITFVVEDSQVLPGAVSTMSSTEGYTFLKSTGDELNSNFFVYGSNNSIATLVRTELSKMDLFSDPNEYEVGGDVVEDFYVSSDGVHFIIPGTCNAEGDVDVVVPMYKIKSYIKNEYLPYFIQTYNSSSNNSNNALSIFDYQIYGVWQGIFNHSETLEDYNLKTESVYTVQFTNQKFYETHKTKFTGMGKYSNARFSFTAIITENGTWGLNSNTINQKYDQNSISVTFDNTDLYSSQISQDDYKGIIALESLYESLHKLGRIVDANMTVSSISNNVMSIQQETSSYKLNKISDNKETNPFDDLFNSYNSNTTSTFDNSYTNSSWNDNYSYPAQSSARDNVPKTRKDLRDKITSWGKCRTVAITKKSGDVAVYGTNGYSMINDCPYDFSSKLKEVHDGHYKISDVAISEAGSWLIVYGNCGLKWNGIPYSLESRLRDWNTKQYTIQSVTFNDKGQWIAKCNGYYSSSDTWIQDWIREGVNQYGSFKTACVTDDCMVLVFERGYKYRGSVPEGLKEALRTTTLKIAHIKIAGNSWFFSDENGSYRYNM